MIDRWMKAGNGKLSRGFVFFCFSRSTLPEPQWRLKSRSRNLTLFSASMVNVTVAMETRGENAPAPFPDLCADSPAARARGGVTPAGEQGDPEVCLSQLRFSGGSQSRRSRKNIPFINTTGRKKWKLCTARGGCDCSRPEWLWQRPHRFRVKGRHMTFVPAKSCDLFGSGALRRTASKWDDKAQKAPRAQPT